MSATREVTQFSAVEFNIFKNGVEEMGVSFQPTTPREKAMVEAVKFLATEPGNNALVAIGGVDNLQRVRVLETAGIQTFDLVPKLPVFILEQKKREEQRKAAMTEYEKLKAGDPATLNKFVKEVLVTLLGRVALKLLIESKKATKKPAKPQRRQPVVERKAPSVVKDPYEAALRQDRRNRIEAAKKAATEFNSKEKRS